jgi:hypothetical protein
MTGAETDLDLGHYERFKVQRLMPARVVEAISDQTEHALADTEEPKAVVLDLIRPLRAGGHCAADGWEARIDEQGGHHRFQGPGSRRGFGAPAGGYHNGLAQHPRQAQPIINDAGATWRRTELP